MLSAVAFLCLSILTYSSDVVTLTSKNYDEYMKKGHIFIKYYSPTCPHCKHVQPTYETLATNFKKYADRVTIAEIDCTKNHDVCDKADVRGYPTFYYYAAGPGSKIEYNGDRSLDDFSDFLGSNIGVMIRHKPKALKEVTPDTWNETVMDPTKNVLVAFTASWCQHCKRLKPQMELAAQSYKPEDNVYFVIIDADKYSDFCEPFEVTGYPTIKFFPAAGEDDDKLAAEQAKEDEKKAAELKKLTDRRDALEALKNASLAENATEEAKAAFGEAEATELQEVKKSIVVEEYTPKVYKKGVHPIELFSGSRSGAGLVDWMNRRAGTMRALGGGVDKYAGLVRELAEPLVRYVHAVTGTPLPKEEPAENVTEAEAPKDDEHTRPPPDFEQVKLEDLKKEEETPETKEVATEEKKEEEKKEEKKEERVPPPPVDEARSAVLDILKNQRSKYVISQYKRYMEQLESKGLEYLDKERARMTSILEAGHLPDNKVLEFTVRKNVLSLFMTI